MTPPGQGDAGEADPRLRAALEAGDEAAVAGALAGARVFVGIESRLIALADPADPEPGPDRGPAAAGGHRHSPRPGLRGEKQSEMVLATLRLPSGATALPVFSSAAALSAWRSAARPVPVAAADACAEAARLGHLTVVVDVAGPVTATLDVSALAGPPDVRVRAQVGSPSTGLRPPARPWDAGVRSRVAAELDALAADGLARGARLWQVDLVTGPDSAAAGPAVAVAVPAAGPGDDARFDEIARRLRAAVVVDPGPAPPVVFVDATQAAALRGSLGRGLAARRWRRRDAPG